MRQIAEKIVTIAALIGSSYIVYVMVRLLWEGGR